MINGSDHPLLRDTAIFPTKSLEEFVNVLRNWLDNLLPGGIVYGNPRLGKTQSIRFLMKNAKTLLGNDIPMTMISCWESSKRVTTENRFFCEMLDSLGYELAKTGTAHVKRRRTIDYMVEIVKKANEHRYVLFFDEAQWLSNPEFLYLMDLHNQLKMKDVRLITILIGQDELLEMKQAFKSAKKSHLTGRFMAGVYQFKGLRGKDDFKRILLSIDNKTEYPIGSGITYTQHFMPKAYSAGWKISDHTSQIWDILLSTLRKEGVPNKKELPMQPIIALIRWLLKTLSQIDNKQFVLDDEVIKRAVYKVALLQIENHTN